MLQMLNIINNISSNETKYYAFFDVDGTLVKGKPMLDFLKFYYEMRYSKSPIIGQYKYSLFRAKAFLLGLFTRSRELQNKLYYKCYADQESHFVKMVGNKWYKNSIVNNSYYKNVVDELMQHQENKAEIVLVSGSFLPCLSRIAEKLNVNYILATSLEEKNGRYTGRLSCEPVIGSGKCNAIFGWMRRLGKVDLTTCYAYGDHISDIPMLSLVGNPVLVTRDVKLKEIAKNLDWKIIAPV
ncbi:MAG: hypothetical protein A3E85_06035 [Gammaproteobacteria bacterium RIFCSPHIGHO2_12_FULL_45_12]|nr:MAG: hypothetical protein A3E85_06035 [Gammaproteobacteria bacterium RIFCSPHIGHO2_12_FULL_45_12]